jgi:hypothetical protein
MAQLIQQQLTVVRPMLPPTPQQPVVVERPMVGLRMVAANITKP